MMMVWLIDSRSRVSTGKRYAWGWKDGDYPAVFRKAWAIVLNAEPWADNFWEEAYKPHSIFEEGQEHFRRYWAEYGWDLTRFDETLLDAADEGGDVVRTYRAAVRTARVSSE